MYPGPGIRAAAAPKTTIPATNSRRTIRRSGLKVEVIDPQIVEGRPVDKCRVAEKPLQRRRQALRRQSMFIQLTLEDHKADAFSPGRRAPDVWVREQPQRPLRRGGQRIVVRSRFIREEGLGHARGGDPPR